MHAKIPTTREAIIAAMYAQLQPLADLPLSDEMLPEWIPPDGLIVMRDGQLVEPEVHLSPLRYHYQRRAKL